MALAAGAKAANAARRVSPAAVKREGEGGEEESSAKRAKMAPRVCQLCGKEAAKMKKCSVCKLARYCSEECQLGDWEKHQKSCKDAEARKKVETGN